jgi:hypothetical protein
MNVKIGIFRPSTGHWFLDVNGNGVLDDCIIGGCLSLGQQGDPLPVDVQTGESVAARLDLLDPPTQQQNLTINNADRLESCTVAECAKAFGLSGDLPVVGDWTGAGQERIGVFDPSTGMWELDLNGNGEFDGCQVDACLGPFGQSGDLPVVGSW